MITNTQLADRRMQIEAVAERIKSRKAQMSRIKTASKRVSSVSQKLKKKLPASKMALILIITQMHLSMHKSTMAKDVKIRYAGMT